MINTSKAHYTKERSAKESVWNYPKSPRVESVTVPLIAVFNGLELARTDSAKRVLQWGIPPTYYFPAEDVRLGYLHKTEHRSYCDQKGFADYWTIRVGERSAQNAVWSYLNASNDITPCGYFAFYAHLLDACFVGSEQAAAPPWVWIGGWVTSYVEGPFITKGQCSELMHQKKD